MNSKDRADLARSVALGIEVGTLLFSAIAGLPYTRTKSAEFPKGIDPKKVVDATQYKVLSDPELT